MAIKLQYREHSGRTSVSAATQERLVDQARAGQKVASVVVTDLTNPLPIVPGEIQMVAYILGDALDAFLADLGNDE